MHYHCEKAAEKRNATTLNSIHQEKKAVWFGATEMKFDYIWNKIYSKTTTTLIMLLGLLTEWTGIPRTGLVPLAGMVHFALQSTWVLYRFNKDEGNESLSFLDFQRDIDNAIFLKCPKVNHPLAMYEFEMHH